MRFLLVTNHCISDPTAGMTHSLRTIAKWLAEAGHTCRVLTTARFGSPVPFTIQDHLKEFGVDLPVGHGKSGAAKAVVQYVVNGIPVTLLMTRSEDERYPDRAETKQFEELTHRLLDEFAPDQLIACNSHPMIQSAIAEARSRTLTTVFALPGLGYYERRFFEHVDHVLTCSEFLTDHYRTRIGLQTTPIEPPIEWSSVLAPEESRAFVTFVHPAPHKGLYAFARLADMLGSRRPDIPILVVQSGQSGGSLNAIRGLDFSKYPQIMAAPATETPAAYFALTRILLVPSVWEEPFGRDAA